MTLAAILMIAAALTSNAQHTKNFHEGKWEEHLEETETIKAIARLGDLSPLSIRERLKQMREPAFLPRSDQINKILEYQELPIANDKRVKRLKAALQPVLDYHERSRMPIYVLYSNLPRANLMGRSAIIITTRMIAIANDQELRGIVAHELAHEYLWDELINAQKKKDGKLMRECELFCDIVAAFTLKELGDDPASYGRILQRLMNVGSLERSTTRHKSETHPSLDARKKLNKFLCLQFN